MAYIKRKDAINEVLTLRDYSVNNEEKVAFSLVYKKLKELPTADVVEVKHGYWRGKPIAGFCTVSCSACRIAFSENSGRWLYCPNCGTKMDGERRDT